MTRSRVCVLGSANVDLVASVTQAPAPGETVFGSAFAITAGGKGLNQAVAAARAGAEVAFIGAVGADDFGLRLQGVLEREGIDRTGLTVSAEPTGIAHIMVTDDGENSIIVVPGANAEEQLHAGDAGLIEGSAVLMAQLERPIALVAEAFRVARAHRVRTVLTPAPVTAGIDELLELADIVVPNAGEACALTGAESARDAAALLAAGERIAVVTCGADGVIVARAGEVVAHVPAVPAPVVVDTTGAGDTLAGVLCARLAAGDELIEAVRAGVVAASLSVRRRGAADAMPTATEISAEIDGAQSMGSTEKRNAAPCRNGSEISKFS